MDVVVVFGEYDDVDGGVVVYFGEDVDCVGVEGVGSGFVDLD